MKLIFMGTPDFAVPALEALIASRHEVCAVVTKPDTPKGRSGKLSASPVKETAEANGIPVLQPAGRLGDDFAAALSAFQADAFIVIAYGRVLPERILMLPPCGCINVHASLLPAYRGAAPIQWAILDGQEKTGVTVMKVGTGLDTGDIYAAAETKITADETADSLFEKLSQMGPALLLQVLEQIERKEAEAVPQPEESPTPYARTITKADGKISWEADAVVIERQVRGMNSWPGAWSMMDGRLIKIWKSRVICGNSEEMPGTVCEAEKDSLLVQTGNGRLKIEELQAEGKKRMSVSDFLKGSRWKAGCRFE